MKRAERHHLKENELQRLAMTARRMYIDRKRETTGLLVGVVALAAIAGGYFLWSERRQSRAHALLAEAMVVQEARVSPPGTPAAGATYSTERARMQAAAAKYKAVADAYPSTDAGIYARYQEAVNQVALGNIAAATAAYQEVSRREGDSLDGQMARLGLAEVQALAGQYDQAINTFKEMAQRKDGPLPIDGILMQLGRTYREAGKPADARQTFNRIVLEFPESPFNQEAKRELDSLNKS
jgi:tetratricopeptide (TPR) repeat protein